MATTWIKALHRSGGNSIAAVLGRATDYIENPDKTEDGQLIDSYECQPFSAHSEFLFAKRLYEHQTGRDQGRNDVIAYHIRQSFKPGEVTAEQALEIGRELVMRWTKGKHQFVVAAHTNTANPHTHIIFNSVNLDCDGKYQDFKRSAIALRRVSDQLCLEYGLSVIEKPGLSKGQNYREYQSGEKAPSQRDRLRALIDGSLFAGMPSDEWIAKMEVAGCAVKFGKHLSFKIPDAKRFIRCDSLGEDYTEEALRQRLSGRRPHPPKQKSAAPASQYKPNLLIDIEAKIQEGYGGGFVHWAKIVNLKEAAKSLIYLQENNLTDYTELERRAADVTAAYHDLDDQLKHTISRMADISHLQKQIGSYSKTREVYRQYRESGYSKAFYNAHSDEIKRHRAAKRYFDEQGYGKDKKLPSMKSLTQEYAALKASTGQIDRERKATYADMRALLTVKYNTDVVLGKTAASEKPYCNRQEMSL